MLTTNNDDLALIINAFREHGAGKNGAKALELLEGVHEEVKSTEQATELYDPFKYFNYLIGYNSRLDAIQAAVLSIKLKYLDDFNSRRASIAERYFEKLDKRIIRPKYNADQKCCWHQFVVRSEYKEELCKYLGEHGVGSGTFYPVPLHQQKAFNDKNSRVSGKSLPVAEMISSQSVCLPVFPEMTESQVEEVIAAVNSFYAEK
jgi:dTDP-4-amino-4,6-dideoxygalactose transaminase